MHTRTLRTRTASTLEALRLGDAQGCRIGVGANFTEGVLIKYYSIVYVRLQNKNHFIKHKQRSMSMYK